jgi:hypothetical protein
MSCHRYALYRFRHGTHHSAGDKIISAPLSVLSAGNSSEAFMSGGTVVSLVTTHTSYSRLVLTQNDGKIYEYVPDRGFPSQNGCCSWLMAHYRGEVRVRSQFLRSQLTPNGHLVSKPHQTTGSRLEKSHLVPRHWSSTGRKSEQLGNSARFVAHHSRFLILSTLNAVVTFEGDSDKTL